MLSVVVIIKHDMLWYWIKMREGAFVLYKRATGEGHVRKRPDGLWEARISIPGGKQSLKRRTRSSGAGGFGTLYRSPDHERLFTPPCKHGQERGKAAWGSLRLIMMPVVGLNDSAWNSVWVMLDHTRLYRLLPFDVFWQYGSKLSVTTVCGEWY
jgi:hypothetical protein